MPTQKTGKLNPDLENERKKCTFDTEEMARWWNGGDQKLAEKRERGNNLYVFVFGILATSFQKHLCRINFINIVIINSKSKLLSTICFKHFFFFC